MNKFRFWFHNARPVALPQSVTPALVAIALAAGMPHFNFWLAVCAFIGIIAMHLAMNLTDDYYDFQVDCAGVRKRMGSDGLRARIPKYPYLEDGLATVRELKVAIASFLVAAALCGIPCLVVQGWPILVFVGVGLLLGFSYSGFPFHLSFHGLGELVIGTMFGPVLMMGVFYAACGTLTPQIVWISIAEGLLVINIVYSHSVLDHAADEKISKMTFARLLRRRGLIVGADAFFNFAPFVIIAVCVATGILHPLFLITLLALPTAAYLFHSMVGFVYGLPRDISPKKWMGPMGDWEGICAARVDWFMIRWLLARNTVTYFSFLLIIASIICALN